MGGMYRGIQAIFAVALFTVVGIGIDEVAAQEWDYTTARIAFSSDVGGREGLDDAAILIGFTSYRSGNNQLYSMDVEGRNVTALTTYPEYGRYNSGCAFSMVTGQFMFVSQEEMNTRPQIATMNLDGSYFSILTDDYFDKDYGDWSPDGSEIVFSRQVDGISELVVMNADGSETVILADDRANINSPAWSPDGTQIIFASDRSGNSLDIYLMNRDGSNIIPLTNDEFDDFEPIWSPDGSRIAFTSFQDGQADIYLMDVDGINKHNLTDHPDDDSSPCWITAQSEN